MDVDRADQLVGQLQAQAELINGVVAAVDGAVAALTHVWFGDNLQTFHGQWVSGQRGQSHGAATELLDTVSKLRNEIAQQRGASGDKSHGGGAGGRHGMSVPGAGVLGFLTSEATRRLAGTVKSATKAGAKVAGIAALFGQNRFSVGRYPQFWNGLTGKVDGFAKAHGFGSTGDLLSYKKSPIFHFLNQHEGLLKDVHSGLKGAGNVLTGATGVMSVIDRLEHGDVRNAVFDGLETGESFIKKSLVGWTATIWTEVGRAATNPGIDYSWHGMQALWASPKEWGDAIVEGIQSPEGLAAVNTITFGIPNLIASWTK